jgi:hypothetical protein
VPARAHIEGWEDMLEYSFGLREYRNVMLVMMEDRTMNEEGTRRYQSID